ncbi:hypothetical protein D3C76_1287690 [compost metagenome]
MAFFAARPIVVNKPTWKYTSLDKPRRLVAISAPMIPNGTTNITAIGIDQLSYNAARHRNTISSDRAYNAGACEPDRRSSYDRPVQEIPTPAGSFLAMASTSAMASPVE